MFKNKPITQLVTGTLVLLFLGLIYAWSIFGASLKVMFPTLSVSQLSLTFTLSMISFTLSSFVGGMLLKSHKPRLNLILTAVMLLIGFYGASTVRVDDPKGSLIKLYIFYGIFSGGGVGIGYNCVLATVKKCFPHNVGLSSGVMLLGFGFGGLALGSSVSALIGNIGIYSVFKILAVVIFLVCFVSSFILVGPNEALANASRKATAENLTPTQMLKDARFWLYLLWAIILNSAGLMIIGSAVDISLFYGGTAMLGLLLSIANGGGRVAGGAFYDKNGEGLTSIINSVILLIASLCLIFAGKSSSLVLIIVGMIAVGLTYGIVPAISAAYINQAFGDEYYAVNFSLVNFNLIPAAIFGPMVSSRLIERSGGSYTSTFTVIAGLALASIAVWAVFVRQNKIYNAEKNIVPSYARKKLNYATSNKRVK